MGGRGSSGGGGSFAERPLAIGDDAIVADWFSFDLPSYAMRPGEVRIIGESKSGKSWKVDIETETLDGERDLYFTRYMPKAAAKTYAQAEREYKEQKKRFEEGVKKYEKLVEFAKKSGVKGVRVGMRKETILKKLNEKGIDYKY